MNDLGSIFCARVFQPKWRNLRRVHFAPDCDAKFFAENYAVVPKTNRVFLVLFLLKLVQLL